MCEPFTVKLCGAACPYSPSDLGDLYDPDSEYWCCGTCSMHEAYRPPGVHFPREHKPRLSMKDIAARIREFRILGPLKR
jgi:hypothetical protein